MDRTPATGRRCDPRLAQDRHGWLHVAEGAIRLNGERLEAGDAAAITGPEDLDLVAESASQVLLFDLA